MRSSFILLVAVAFSLAGPMKSTRFLRATKTEEEDDGDDGDVDSEDEERMNMPGFLSKLFTSADDATAAATKKLQPQQLSQINKVDDVKPSYLNNPMLRPEGEALAAAKAIEAQWIAQLTKTDKALLKKIETTPGAARRISEWKLAEWDPTKLASYMKNNYPTLWTKHSAEKEAWNLYAAMFLRQHFSLRPTVPVL